MWRHRYSNQWIWHVQWTGTPERLNIRRGSALTKWSQKKKKKPNPTTSPSLFIGTEALKGLTSGASAHSSEARKIRRAYPTFFSLFLFSSTLPFLPPSFFFLHLRLLLALGRGHAWDHRRGTFGEADWVGGRDAQTLLGAAASVSGYPCSLEYKTQHQLPFTAKCALCPATWIWVIISWLENACVCFVL